MRILQDIRPDQFFVVSGSDLFSEEPVVIQLDQIIKWLVVGVQPAVEDVDGIDQSLGISAVIRFTIAELHRIDRSLDRLRVQTLFTQLLQCGADHFPEPLFILPVRVLCDHGEDRLADPGIVGAVYVLADPRIQQSHLERCAGGLQQDIVQHREGVGQPGIAALTRDHIPGKIGIVLERVIFTNRILGENTCRFGEGLLDADLGINRAVLTHLACSRFKCAQVFTVEVFQSLFKVHLTVQIDVGIGRVVISSVKIQELLIGQIRNALGISARIHAVGGIRKQGIHDLSLQHIIRRGIGPLHLIVDDAVDHDRIIRVLDLITPAFLAEDHLISVDVRVEHRIQIDVHQIPEVLVVAACHREHGLVRIGHGIEKCIHGTLDQLYERVLGRILLRAAQDRMLYDMRNARGIHGGGAEGDIEYLIVVFIFNEHNTGAGLVVLQDIAC